MAKATSMKGEALAVLSAGSDVDTNRIATVLCGLFVRAGLQGAPFQAQNMSNNPCVTWDGKEIGLAPGLEAQASASILRLI